MIQYISMLKIVVLNKDKKLARMIGMLSIIDI